MFLLKILVNQMCLKIWFKEDECRKPSWQRIDWKPRSNLIWNVLKHRCLVLHRESHDVSDASQQSSRLRLKNTLEKWECQYCIHLFIMHIVYISQFWLQFSDWAMTQIWCCMTSFPVPWSLGFLGEFGCKKNNNLPDLHGRRSLTRKLQKQNLQNLVHK